jgi:enterochelin esterase-like enzyme
MKFHLAFVLSLTCVIGLGQETLQSPELNADKTFTLRLLAPKASEVTVAGEWNLNKPQALSKDGKGVWTITVGPVPPNIYIYAFNVDGVTITDPINPSVKLRARTSASMVHIPGDQPWDFRDVPHGSIEINVHRSAVLGGAQRQIFVYTPPDYHKSRSTRYPVLYLLHGSNDLAAGWTFAGNANLILDNFQADKKAVPMIVVMPWGHAIPFGSRPGPNEPGNNARFEEYLLKEVMPLMEAKYRISPGRKNRALMGLSMGGGQTLQTGLTHLDLFSGLGVFGNGMTRADFENRHKAVLDDVAGTNKKLDLFWIGVGKDDPIRARAKELSDTLTSNGISHKYHETDGGHTYPVWRKLLTETAPLLFKKGALSASD